MNSIHDTMFVTDETDMIVSPVDAENVRVSLTKSPSILVDKRKLLQAICPQPRFVQITTAADGIFVLFALDSDGLIWKMEFGVGGIPQWKVITGPEAWRRKQ